MTAQYHKSTDEEFEVQARNFLRVVSACTLGLWSFSAGLLIGQLLSVLNVLQGRSATAARFVGPGVPAGRAAHRVA